MGGYGKQQKEEVNLKRKKMPIPSLDVDMP